jgi:prepilin-type N-terminal cleavage/methylation domain-containing protein/prepilin-type processing-associated H-X9-DG protein
MCRSKLSPRSGFTRSGFTLVELLVVIAIIGVLVALLLPAVQAARESARRMQCTNNLRQMALAVHNFENTFKVFPSHGTGGSVNYVNGTPAAVNGDPPQAAGALFQILPYLELGNLYNNSDFNYVRAQTVKYYFCPTRRKPTTRLNNSSAAQLNALNDYAIPLWGASGGGINQQCWGLPNNNVYDVRFDSCIFVRAANGLVGRPADVTDGLTNTMMFGEKFVDVSRYTPPAADLDPAEQAASPNSGFTDNGYWGGVTSWGTTRCTQATPKKDARYPSSPTNLAWWQMFGGPHAGGLNISLGDGSVRAVSWQVPGAVFQLLARKNDGLLLDASSF